MADVLIKGSVVRDTMGYILKKQGEAGLERAINMLDADSQDTFHSPITTADWVSLDAYAALLEVVVREFEGRNEANLTQRAERVFDKQLKGVYRMFVRLGSPEWIIKRISAVHATYFKGVEMHIASTEDHRIVIRYTGFTKKHRLLEYNIQGFYRKALEISGAKDVTTRFTVPMAQEAAYSELTVSWR
jgi:hypothetical protein